MSKYVKRLWGSPLKILAFLMVVCGLVLLIMVIDFWHAIKVLMIAILGCGIGLYIFDFVGTKYIKSKRRYLLSQLFIIIFFTTIVWLGYLKSTSFSTIVLSHKDRKEAVIIWGINGYPPVPKGWLWRTNLIIPENGILITSSSPDDLPGYCRGIMQGGFTLNKRINHISQPCIVNNNLLKVYYISGDSCQCHYETIPRNNTRIQNHCYAVYDSLALGLLKSSIRDPYYSDVIFSDSRGEYFDTRHLNKKWEGCMPDCISQFNWYKAVFSGSNVYVIPSAIMRNPNITELYFKDSRLSEIDTAIVQMTDLKILDVSNTPCDKFPKSLAALKYLETLNITNTPNSRKELKRLKKMLPNTTIIHN